MFLCCMGDFDNYKKLTLIFLFNLSGQLVISYIKMNHIKMICKDPVKVQQKLQGKQFLLGKYFDLKNKCARCKKDKQFQKSKRQKLLKIQDHITIENSTILNSKMDQEGLTQKQALQDKVVQMQNQDKSLIIPKQNQRVNQRVNRKISSHLTSPQYSHEYFLPLNKLWRCYMYDLIQGEKNQQSACLKLLRSDFVGAQIQIVYSKIQSYIGHKGIIIQETLKTFVLVKTPLEGSIEHSNEQVHPMKSKQNSEKKTITLLKNEIVFQMQIGQKSYILNGNTLTYRPSDRSKHKFKVRIGEKLNLDFMQNFIQ